MLGRKQELSLQFLQIVDGLLLVIAFWVAHTIRFVAPDMAEAAALEGFLMNYSAELEP